MTLVIIDGPEKAGKSTLIQALVEHLRRTGREAESIHWGRMDSDDRVYSSYVMNHVLTNKIWVWDRGWPSEHVYGVLLNRDRRMRDNPWIGEWLHGRATQTNGVRIILTGPSPEELSNLRDESDHLVDPRKEQELYAWYGNAFKWKVIQNQHTKASLNEQVQKIDALIMANAETSTFSASRRCGPPTSKVGFFGAPEYEPYLPGGWLPFTSSRASAWAQHTLGYSAFDCQWMNEDSLYDPPELLSNFELLVLCGTKAEKVFKEHTMKGDRPKKIISLSDAEMAKYHSEAVSVAVRDALRQA